MHVACFCGHQFEVTGALARCPHCREVSTVPRVSSAAAAQMHEELGALLAEHSPEPTLRDR